jgi:hypothetical protein
MFAIGRVINPLTARSQLIGGMITGLSMALHEEGIRDPPSGRHVNADLATYRIAAPADVPDVEADFVPDHEPDIPMEIKGAGEIGTVGTAARSPTPSGTPPDSASARSWSVTTAYRRSTAPCHGSWDSHHEAGGGQ